MKRLGVRVLIVCALLAALFAGAALLHYALTDPPRAEVTSDAPREGP